MLFTKLANPKMTTTLKNRTLKDMKNVTVALIVGFIAVGIVSGTLTVQFHADRLSGIGTWALAAAGNYSVVEQARALAITWERKGEAYVMKDKNKSVDVALAYAKSDLQHVSAVAEKASDVKTLAPAVTLLLDSLDKLTGATKDITVDKLAQVKPDISKVFADTKLELDVIESKGVTVADFKDRFLAVGQNMEGYIGSLHIGQVAGTDSKNKATATVAPTPTPKATIAPRF